MSHVAVLTRPHNGRGAVPGPQPLPPRLPVRGVLLEQLLDAARGRGHRPPHAAAALDRPQPDLRRRERSRERRARDRRGDGQGDRVFRARRLPVRVDARDHGSPAQLDVGPLPERPRQRQRRARPQPDGPPRTRPAPPAATRASRTSTTPAGGRTGMYIPRFRNLKPGEGRTFTRGYGYEVYTGRERLDAAATRRRGSAPTSRNRSRGPAAGIAYMEGYGETLPCRENSMSPPPRQDGQLGPAAARRST